MVSLMIDENATQSGSRSAVVFNEVEAVTQRLVKVLHENESGQIQPDSLMYRVFEGRSSFARAKQSLLSGEGIGWRLIQRYLGHGDEDHCPRSKPQIIEAIAALKQSGKYDEILRQAGINTQQEEEQDELARIHANLFFGFDRVFRRNANDAEHRSKRFRCLVFELLREGVR